MEEDQWVTFQRPAVSHTHTHALTHTCTHTCTHTHALQLEGSRCYIFDSQSTPAFRGSIATVAALERVCVSSTHTHTHTCWAAAGQDRVFSVSFTQNHEHSLCDEVEKKSPTHFAFFLFFFFFLFMLHRTQTFNPPIMTLV